MNRKVPFFDYPHVYKQYEDEFLNIFKNVIGKGAYILQQEGVDFETHLAEFLDARHAVGVGNCTDGLYLALRAAGIGRGDEVIFSSHTFVATASAIHHTGASPIPVECGDDHLIDPHAVEAAITSRTKAIIPTQLNGHICDMDAIMKIADKNGLVLIEDAAQSLGAKYKGKCAGTFGAASAFSFYPAKVIGCFGDGGAVSTNDTSMHSEINLLRDHGRAKIGEVLKWGVNSRLDNFHAAILDFKLKHYPKDIDRRREIASLYEKGLYDVAEIKLPRSPTADVDRFEIYQNYEIETDEKIREDLRLKLGEKGIGSILQWGGKAVHEWEGLNLDFKLPYTEQLMKRAFMVPMSTALSNDDILYVIDNIRTYFGYSKFS